MRRLLAAFLGALGLSAFAADAPKWTAGPFTIETKFRRISSGTFPNISGNPFARTTIAEYQIRYRGKTVGVKRRDAEIDQFVDARILAEAPQPAILAVGAAVWLVTEVAGELQTRLVSERDTDLGNWQWLDARDGQPGEQRLFSIRDSSAEPRELRGGRLLLLHRRTVLDVATLKSVTLEVNSSPNVRRLQEFNAGNEDARAVSPARSQIAFVGSRRVGDFYEYALVVAEWEAGAVYALPFDSNELRFESVHDATPAWIARNFEWTRDAAGKERLVARANVTPAPWQGRFSRDQGGRIEYRLAPARRELLDALASLVEGEFRGKIVADPLGLPESADRRTYDVDGKLLNVSFNANERYVALYAATLKSGFPVEGSHALVERTGERFNTLLAGGAHQAHFDRFKGHR